VAWSSCVTGLIGAIVIAASLMIRDEESLKSINLSRPGDIAPTNLGAFLPSTVSAPIKAVAGNIDVFSIWYLILLTIGFAAIAGTRKIKTAQPGKVVFGLWFIWLVVRAGFAAITGF